MQREIDRFKVTFTINHNSIDGEIDEKHALTLLTVTDLPK